MQGQGVTVKESAETHPLLKVKATPTDNRSWRMKQQLLSYEQFEEAKGLLSRPDQESRLRGLALVLHAKFNAVGWPYMDAKLMPLVVQAVAEMDKDSRNYTTLHRPNGRYARISTLKPSHYIIMKAGEALAAAYGWGLATTPDILPGMDTSAMIPAEYAAVVLEHASRVLMRLSGNLGSAVTNADGSPNAALLSGGQTAIHDVEGTVPGSVLVTVQLMHDYKLHPKKIAWVMQDMLYTISKGPAHQRHLPSQKQMMAAANAMVAMASSDSGTILDPKEAAAAAVNATNAACEGWRATHPEPASQAEPAAAAAAAAAGQGSALEVETRLIHSLSVKDIKTALTSAGINHSQCVEKAELVSLLAGSRNMTAVRKQQAPLIDDPRLQQPERCDISPWLHMALLFRAEAGESAEGRSAAVQDMYRAAVAAVQACPGGDELYGLLISSNVLRVLVDGGTPFKAGEGLQLLDWSVSAKAQLKSWHFYNMMAPRVRLYYKATEQNFKDLIAMARKVAQQQSGSSSSSSSSSSGSSLSILNPEVRELLQPHEEGLLLTPHPSRATCHINMATAESPVAKPCANCQQLFHVLRRCKPCQSVEYCGKDCQLAHWKVHKKQCKQVQQEKEAAAAAKAAKR